MSYGWFIFWFRMKMFLFSPVWLPLGIYSILCTHLGIEKRWMICVEVCELRKRLGYRPLERDYKEGDWEWYDWNSNFICCDVLKRYWGWFVVWVKEEDWSPTS